MENATNTPRRAVMTATLGAIATWRTARKGVPPAHAAPPALEVRGDAPEERIDIKRDEVAGWTVVAGQWTVEDMAGAPDRQRALVQRATRNPFNVIVQKEFGDLPGVGPEEVKAMLDAGERVQIVDARPRSYISRQQDIMEGAVWRDPERLDEWVGELSKSDPVVVFCAYGFHVGCKTAIALRDQGFDAKYMKGGHSAWKAIGGPIKLHTA